MFGYIYETTDLMNGSTYIGQHTATKFDPKYLGSGSRLADRIKKYGRSQLAVKLIAEAESQEELDKLERYYIAKYREAGKAEYNVANGGQGKANIFGCRWMFKDNVTIPVPEELTQRYLDEGYKFGRAINIHNQGKIGVHKDGVNKYIQPNELDYYLDNGWERKFNINYVLPDIRGLKWIHKDGKKKLISPEDKDKYPDWEYGNGDHSNHGVSEMYIKGHIFIHKGIERKVILPEERDNFPEWEDGIGPVGPRSDEYMWIHKDNERHFIPKQDRDKYPDWEDGNGLQGLYTWIHKDSELKHILRSDRDNFPDWEDGIGNCSPLKGKRMWINNGKECKYIEITDRDSYPDWQDGQGTGTRKVSIPAGRYMWINKDGKQTRISKEERANYPDWQDGKVKGTHMWIHNNIESKFINKSERDQYPTWVEGHL